ncbi:MAG: aldehyde ferredoxin oxidoreductase family protein [Candidatus Bathyarchaeia archaeon]
MRVNLSDSTVGKEEIPKDFPKRFLGGIGFASWVLYQELKHVKPLSPENKLIIAPGLLAATGIPTASKTVFVSRSPLTKGFGRAVAGASFGFALKKAGYDLLIVEGKSVEPVVIYINDQKIEIEDANDLWGKNVREVTQTLKSRYDKASTAVIGPAGENLSLIADIDCEERQAARTGLGAVMGSKKLKGMVAKGTSKVEVADWDALRSVIVKWSKILREHPASKLDIKYGTAEFYDWINRDKGVFPSRNWQQGYFHKSFDKLKEKELSKLDPYYWAPIYTVRSRPCPNCTKPCGRIVRITEGKYAGTELDGPEFETIYSLGGNLEIDDVEALCKLHLACDLYGLDALSAGLTISWAMEAFEKGLLNKEDLDGVELQFGDVDATLKVLKAMALRKGKIGQLLADGVKAASERLGKGSEKFAIHSKGLELPAYDLRGMKGMALASAVSVRGGDHLTAGVYGTELVGKWWKFSGVNRFSAENKGFEVKIHQDLMAVYDILGVCKFSRHMFYVEAFPEMVKAVTGMNMDVSELLMIGERVYNIQRAFNAREGFGRKDDTLPYRVLAEPIPKGKSKGSYVKPKELEKMLDEYYQARGWSEDGVPTKAKLVALGLPEIAEEIGVGH